MDWWVREIGGLGVSGVATFDAVRVLGFRVPRGVTQQDDCLRKSPFMNKSSSQSSVSGKAWRDQASRVYM